MSECAPRDFDKTPPRGPLPAHIIKAAQTVSSVVWKQPYVIGEGPMHYAGGPYWHNELLRRADAWERWAKAARLCAEVLPDA
jgi:hypothetical protein